MSKEDTLILIGVISAAHGLNGHVVIKSYTAPEENILKHKIINDKFEEIKLKKTRITPKGTIICKPANSNTRNDSERLLGTKLYCTRADLPEAGEDEFYIEDLKGLEVRNPSGEKIGEIFNIANFGAGDIVEIEFLDGKSEMFPFNQELFPTIEKNYLVLSTR